MCNNLLTCTEAICAITVNLYKVYCVPDSVRTGQQRSEAKWYHISEITQNTASVTPNVGLLYKHSVVVLLIHNVQCKILILFLFFPATFRDSRASLILSIHNNPNHPYVHKEM